MPYFSKRNKKYDKNISKLFFNSFKAFINEIETKEWYDDYYLKPEINFSKVIMYPDFYKISNKITIELGKKYYPLEEIIKINQEEILDLIEFFYKIIKPEKRYEYTIEINKIFNNYKLLFQLKKGKIKYKNNNIIDNYILSEDISINDPELKNMLNIAIEKFYSNDFKEQKLGLEKLVDAYQRLSSLLDKEKKNL